MGSSAARLRLDENSLSTSAFRGPAASGPLTLEEIVSHVRTVPVAPEIFPKLQVLLNDFNTEVGDVSKLIKLDAGLATSMLKMANSAYYARGESVVDVEEAISRIGFQDTLRLVVRCSYASVLRGELSCYGISGDGLWRDAVLTAFAMDQLSATVGVDRSAGYVVGLLHGVGMAAIDDFLKRKAVHAPQFSGSGRTALINWERETIGFTHAEVGGAMLRRWKVPAPIVEAVEQQLDERVDDDGSVFAVLLPVAFLLGQHVMDLSDDTENPVAPLPPVYNPALLERTGLDEEKLAGVTEAVGKVWAEAGKAML